MTKQENIFNLYDQLGHSGERGNASSFIAELSGVKKVTVKGHWLQNREFPDYMLTEENEHKLDKIIFYLQNAISQQNQISA